MDNQNNDHEKQDDEESQEGDTQITKGNSSQAYDDDDDEGTPAKGKATQNRRAGRRKINIEFIGDKSRRHITFSKRKAGIMKKAYELSTLTGTQVLLLVASETGHVYTFATPKLQPLITKTEGKNLIQACLNAPDPQPLENQQDMGPGGLGGDQFLPQQSGSQQGHGLDMDGNDIKKMRGDMKSVPVQQYSQSQQQMSSPTPSQGGYGSLPTAHQHLPSIPQQHQYSAYGDFSQMRGMGVSGMSHMGNQYQNYGVNPNQLTGSPIDNSHKVTIYANNMHNQGVPHDTLNQYHQN